ncbi:hypothetical protein ACHQM5_005858 [Ranunculus cassubicifolius]
MEANNSSYGATWADQWESNPYAVPPQPKEKKSSSKYGKKFGESFDKSKVVAGAGLSKLKHATSMVVHWIKVKRQQRKENQEY